MTDPVEQAWKIHAAQVDWTGKVDSKASFAFAIESAALATTVALTASDRILNKIDGCIVQLLFLLGIAGLILGVACALLAVTPRLGESEALSREAKDHFIYFGHLRHWEPDALAERLKTGSILDVLTKQCVTMAGIAWRKHRLVKTSFTSGAAGIGLLLACGLVIAA